MAAVVLVCLVPLGAVAGLTLSAGSDAAALSVTGSPCGFHLGPPLETHATSMAAFQFPIYPADPHQVCGVTVDAEASLATATGGSYLNVSEQPATTLTLQFNGDGLPLGAVWTWAPACADPPVPGTVTLSLAGQLSSIPVSPTSCFPDLGGASRFSYDSSVGIQPDPSVAVGIAATADGSGYWAVVASGAAVTARGDAPAPGLLPPVHQVVGMAADTAGQGYWVAASDGGVFSFGGAPFSGSAVGLTLAAPVVGMAATPDGHGYWLAAADGGVFSFGDAAFYGSLAGHHLNAPVVGIAATPDGHGYWLAAADGGVFSFGDAAFHGSAGATTLAAPVVGIAATPNGGGYWLAAYDGGVLAFGDAVFRGSAAGLPLDAPVTALAATPTGRGYWLLGGDGGVFTFGDARFYGTAQL